MITLFKSAETNFNSNGLGTLDNDIINPIISETLNGAYTFTFQYPIFAKHGTEIEGLSLIRAPVPDSTTQRFRVSKINKSMGYIVVTCNHIFYDLLDNFIEDTNVVTKNGQDALNQISKSTQFKHDFVFHSDLTNTATSRIVRMNPVEALLDTGQANSFINRWGGQIKRDNYDVYINKSIAKNVGVTIRNKKNLAGYEADVDWTSVVTRIMPKGYNGLLLPEKYVDSPNISNYPSPKIKVIEYTDIKAVEDGKEATNGEVTLEQAYALMRAAAQKEFTDNHLDNPQGSYKVTFVNLSDTKEYEDIKVLEKVTIGDEVRVIHDEDRFETYSKVIQYTFNPLSERYIDVSLGAFVQELTVALSDAQTNNDTNIDNANENANDANQNANDAQESADNAQNSADNAQADADKNADDLVAESNDRQNADLQQKQDAQKIRDDMTSAIAKQGADIQNYLDGVGGDMIYGRNATTAKNSDGTTMKFTALGLGYYSGSSILTTAVTNRGEVYASKFIGNLIQGVDIIGATITGGTVTGQVYINITDGSRYTVLSTAGLTTDGSMRVSGAVVFNSTLNVSGNIYTAGNVTGGTVSIGGFKLRDTGSKLVAYSNHDGKDYTVAGA